MPSATKAKPKKAKKTTYTHISILLDRSGSMAYVKEDTIGGFNQFLSEQITGPGRATLTLTQFDTPPFETLYENVPIKDVRPLTGETYQPRGNTALLDATAKAIADTSAFLGTFRQGKKKKPDQILFVILTDGHENSSTEVDRTALKKMVEEKTEKEKWQFVYLGANQNAFHEAGQIGIQRHHTINYQADSVGTSSALASMSAGTRSYRESGKAQSEAFFEGVANVEDQEHAKKARRSKSQTPKA